jgi:hypothetical protein
MVPTHLLPAQSNPWGRKSLLRGAGEHEAMDFDKKTQREKSTVNWAGAG